MSDNNDTAVAVAPDDGDKFQERNQQTIADIQNLQSIERDLYSSLEAKSATTGKALTPAERDALIAKINEIAQMRINLYENLRDMHSFYKSTAEASKSALAEQTAAIAIVERELNENKARIQRAKDETVSKFRMVEINTYYGKKYHAYAYVAKVMVAGAMVALVLATLRANGWLPQIVFGGLIALTAIVVMGLCLHSLADTTARDSMNFDAYSWWGWVTTPPSGTSSTTTDSGGGGSEPLPWEKTAAVCVGETCCTNGLIFDATKGVCVTTSAPTATTASDKEAFATGVIARYAFAHQPIDAYIAADEGQVAPTGGIWRGGGGGGGGGGGRR